MAVEGMYLHQPCPLGVAELSGFLVAHGPHHFGGHFKGPGHQCLLTGMNAHGILGQSRKPPGSFSEPSSRMNWLTWCTSSFI